MAPGPVLGRYWPIGGYGALAEWVAAATPISRRRFRTAMNQSLTYAQAHPDEVRGAAPGRRAERPAADLEHARRPREARPARALREGVRRHPTLPNLTQLVPSRISGGKTLQGTVGDKFITLRQDGKGDGLAAGKYTFVVTDSSKTQDFQLVGPGVNKQTSVAGTGRATWTVTLKKGTYV